MNGIKKGFITASAIAGGALGGLVRAGGQILRAPMIEELGNAVLDSAVLTGTIAGQLVSGAADWTVGIFSGEEEKKEQGTYDLKEGTGKIIGNVKENLQRTVKNGKVIADGVRTQDKEKVIRGAKTIVKMAAVGAITVGAVKVPENDEE